MVLDPHSRHRRRRRTAVRRRRRRPVVSLATAHPAKFPDAVEAATGRRPELPEHLADLLERPERTQTVANELGAVERLVEQLLGR